MPKNTSINELNPQKIYDQEIAESLTPCLKTNCRHGKMSCSMGSRIFQSPFVIEKGAKRKSHILTLPQKMCVQFKFIKHKTKTPVFGLINLTHYQGRKGNINNELNL